MLAELIMKVYRELYGEGGGWSEPVLQTCTVYPRPTTITREKVNRYT